MSALLRLREPGLQPERTVLAWQRTVFSVLVVALVAVRLAFVRGEAVFMMISVVAAILGLALVVISYWRQKTVFADVELTTGSSLLAKRLICAALFLTALSLALPALFNLIQRAFLIWR